MHGAQSYTPMNERLRRSTDENNSMLSNSVKGSVTETKQDLGASQLSSQMQLSELNSQHIGLS